MKKQLNLLSTTLVLLLSLNNVWADEYSDTVNIFKNAGESAGFFKSSYGYALFPTIGKGGLVVGGAHGSGRVYKKGIYIGDTSMTQVTVGFQLGGQAFSQIIFFKDSRALNEFISEDFEFGAQVSAVAITAAAQASSSTTSGSTAGASGGKNNANTSGNYSSGMAIFTVAKGGLMYEASVGGQGFSYKANK